MNRREFLVASAAAGVALGVSPTEGRAQDKPGKQLLELRRYRFSAPAKQKAFEDFFAKAAIPALRRASIGPVGVFELRSEDNPKLPPELAVTDLFVLLPHGSPESFVMLPRRLAEDAAFQKAGEAILRSSKSDPAYSRYESSLMLAFDEVPQVKVPTKAPSRLLQLRIYESHNAERALKKIEMFNTGGELEIFARCGLRPVFFGQSLTGWKLPNLTYMLSFENNQAKDTAWGVFGRDPEWRKLRADAAYKDTVSGITNLILRPAPGSEI